MNQLNKINKKLERNLETRAISARFKFEIVPFVSEETVRAAHIVRMWLKNVVCIQLSFFNMLFYLS